MDDPQTSYAVKLPAFEGPLDLLLHLIRKNEVNIYDIPIALITRQYLEYLDLFKSLNLAVAGDFLVMAATLIHVKSKMLLPPSETEEVEEDEDPRTELVMRLLEYQRFKEAAQGLETREQEWREVFHRPASLGSGEPTDEINLVDLSLFDLLEALRGVMQRAPEKKDLEIVVDALSVQERMGLILDRLDAQESITFTSLFEDDTTRLAMVVTFLALLELIRLKRLRILQTELFGTIRIWKSTSLQPS
jgi:segregation and condensation protein A